MTEARGLSGQRGCRGAAADQRQEVAEVVAWCYAHGVVIVPRGGGTGYAGGLPSLDGGVVLSLERLDRVRSFDPLLLAHRGRGGASHAGGCDGSHARAAAVRSDPGAAEQSADRRQHRHERRQPHAFKYGVTGKWVTGLEVVVPPGELVQLGGPLTQGRRGLRPQAPADRIGGHARRDHRRVAAAHTCAGGRLARQSDSSTASPAASGRSSG